MAMRPASRIGGAATPSHPRTAVEPVYENFRPVSERKKDEESNVLLLIYLPGFLKQHLKVSTEGRNIVRVRGERLVAGNKWSRFQEDYPVPEDCNMRGIHAKFEGDILTITMPRKKESAKPVPEAPISPFQKRVSQEDLTSKTRTSPYIEREPSSSTATTPSNDVQEVRETELKHPKPQKPKKFQEESRDDLKISGKVDKRADDQVENFEELKSQKHKGNGDSGKKGKYIEPDEKQPRKDVASGSVDQSGIGNYKKSVGSLMELNEEKQLLVNVGVAVLVIVALGAYVSYTFGSEAAK